MLRSLPLLFVLSTRTSAALDARYDHTGLGAGLGGQPEAAGTWTKYDTIVLLHAVCGFIAWQIVAPLAVVVAAIGRDVAPVWFHMHWMLQVLVVAPLTIAAVVLGSVAAKLGDDTGTNRHAILGFTLLAIFWLQLGIGYWQRHPTPPPSIYVSPPISRPSRRSASNYIHITVGITLLTLGGLDVTWGFAQYTAHPLPAWIRPMHYVLAALPILLTTPFILLRGIRRLRAGQSFLEAFVQLPDMDKRSPAGYVPPRKLWLNDGAYREMGTTGGEGFVYAKGGGVGGSAVVGTQEEEEEVGWDGARTREEYEEALMREGTQIGRGVSGRGTVGHGDVASRGEEEEVDEVDGLAEHEGLLQQEPRSETYVARTTTTTYPPPPLPLPSPPPPITSSTPFFLPPIQSTFVSPTLLPPPPPQGGTTISHPPPPALSPSPTHHRGPTTCTPTLTSQPPLQTALSQHGSISSAVAPVPRVAKAPSLPFPGEVALDRAPSLTGSTASGEGSASGTPSLISVEIGMGEAGAEAPEREWTTDTFGGARPVVDAPGLEQDRDIGEEETRGSSSPGGASIASVATGKWFGGA